MQISLVNFSSKPDAEVLHVVRAINRQLTEDFTPIWSWCARLRVEGAGRAPDDSVQSLKQAPQDLRGDAIIYLWDRPADVDDALGYHEANNRGLPYGFVFTKLSEQLNEAWSTTLSHEVLELVGDANANTFAAGPHPKDPERLVFHWYEMCDAVQAESYDIDGVQVSNFVLPQYFTVGEQAGARNDFLNLKPHGKPLPSFGINPGGYVGFFDPATNEHSTITADRAADERLAAKSRLGSARARRSLMYKQLTPGKPSAGLQAPPAARRPT